MNTYSQTVIYPTVYNGDLLLINNKKINKIIQYKIGYMKLWASNTGRNMAGSNRGTMIGIFPKLFIKIGKMDEDEMSEFLSIVNKASANVTYYDTEYKRQITMSFYFGDAIDELNRKRDMTHKAIEINIIANDARE